MVCADPGLGRCARQLLCLGGSRDGRLVLIRLAFLQCGLERPILCAAWKQN